MAVDVDELRRRVGALMDKLGQVRAAELLGISPGTVRTFAAGLKANRSTMIAISATLPEAERTAGIHAASTQA